MKIDSLDTHATVDVVAYENVGISCQNGPHYWNPFLSLYQGVDEAVDLVAGHADDEPLDPQEARKIRNKIDWVILPLLFSLYTSGSPQLNYTMS